MVEHSIALKLLTTIGHGLMWLAVALGVPHFFEFITLQVDQHIFLSPYFKILLDETTQILVVLVELFILVKVIMGINKLRKDKKQ